MTESTKDTEKLIRFFVVVNKSRDWAINSQSWTIEIDYTQKLHLFYVWKWSEFVIYVAKTQCHNLDLGNMPRFLNLFTRNQNHIQLSVSFVDSVNYHDFRDSNICHYLFGRESQGMLLSENCWKSDSLAHCCFTHIC